MIFREMMKSKIHRAVVTQANLNYVGSVTIDVDLMEAANLLPNEKVDIVNISNGARLSTYIIEGARSSGVIGINGAAARLVSVGDLVIIISYISIDDDLARKHRPAVVFVSEGNTIVDIGADAASAPEGANLMSGNRVDA